MQRVRGLYEPVLRQATAIAARSDADAARFRSLGASAECVRTTGDLKEDREVGAWEPPRVDGWIAACTRPGEEEIVLEALATIAKARPAGELALAPRHPERFEEVAAICERAGVALRRWRDRAARSPSGWSVLLVDEMGVLDEAYRRATCAFVGGSLAPLGGHSPWEAAAAGRAVLTGPHVAHCRDAVESLRAAGAATEVRTADELAARVAFYPWPTPRPPSAGRAARATLAARSGAGIATVEFFLERGLLR
jgi:3-deoxy-D-manno-octulosonic-acid transferase